MIDSNHATHATGGLPDVLRPVLEWLPIGLLMISPGGAIVLANRELEYLFGYARGELVGRAVDVLLPEATPAIHEELRETHAQPAQPGSIGPGREVFARHQDGSEVPVEVRLTRVVVGDATLVLASVIDLRDRPRARREPPDERQQQLQVGALIGEFGVEFVHLHAADVDRAFEEALGRVGRALDLDRGVLFQLVKEGAGFVTMHEWTRPGYGERLPPAVSVDDVFPWHMAQMRAGELVSVSTLDDVPHETDRDSMRRLGTKSGVMVPLVESGAVVGAVSFAATRESRTWSPDVIHRLRVVALMFAHLLARKRREEALHAAAIEGARVQARLRDENAYLRRELKGFIGESAIVGHSAAMRRVIEKVQREGATDSIVLLVGEAGTGKARLAEWIHDRSARSERTLVRVNCASLSSASSAVELLTRRLALADMSTILLTEIGHLPVETQASLARVLTDRRIQPVGGGEPVNVNVRVIATTSKDLTPCIAAGTFRQDLYDLLGVAPIHVAPLRERPEDIPLLVWRFVDEFSESLGKPIDAIDKGSMAALQRYPWPGNARELRNVVERAMIVANARRLHVPIPDRTLVKAGARRAP